MYFCVQSDMGFTRLLFGFTFCFRYVGSVHWYFKTTNFICKLHDTCICMYIKECWYLCQLDKYSILMVRHDKHLLLLLFVVFFVVFVSYCLTTKTIQYCCVQIFKCTTIWCGEFFFKEKRRKDENEELFIIYKWSLDANGMQNKRGAK